MTNFVWGRRPVAEALRAGRVRRVWLLADAHLEAGFEAALRDAWHGGVRIEEVDRRHLDRLTDGANHQGVVAEVAPYRYADFEGLLAEVRASPRPALLLALDHVQDPQNLGTLLRTAESAGVHGVLLPRARAAGVTPAVARASSGATEHLRIAQVPNLARALEALKAAGVWTLALDAEARQRPDEVDLTVPLAVIVGAEGSGVSRLVRERCDLTVALPMRGRVASLNAAVAGSIVLYEAWRQRGWERA